MDSSESSDTDANWCQIKETLAMLYISTAQIETSMHEDTNVFQQLSDALTSISAASNQIEKSIEQLKEQGSNEDHTEAKLSAIRIREQVGLGVTACQIHDRNTQRLEHVSSALSKLCGIISSPEKYHAPKEWQQIQDEIQSSYTMETERLMFEHIMMGASVEEALEIYHHNFNDVPLDDDSSDDIELF